MSHFLLFLFEKTRGKSICMKIGTYPFSRMEKNVNFPSENSFSPFHFTLFCVGPFQPFLLNLTLGAIFFAIRSRIPNFKFNS